MALPISEQISENVAQRLATITTANGYGSTITVERANMHRGSRPENNVAVIYEGDEQREEDPPAGYFQYLKPFDVLVWIMEAEDSKWPLDKRANIVRADIEKAIMSDPFWDGLASNTFLQGIRRFDPALETYGCVVSFDIQYRVLETDPYSQ